MLKATKKAMRRAPKRKSNDKLQYTELDYACIGIRSEFVPLVPLVVTTNFQYDLLCDAGLF